MLARSLIIKTSSLPPIEKMVRRSGLFRPLVKRFIAGDTLDEALLVSQDLVRRGFKVSLDNLGENTKSEAEANQAKATYMEMLRRIAELPESKGEKINISIKLTQCGLDLGEHVAENNLREVLDVAKSHDNFVRVDMEASAYTERTMSIMCRVLLDYYNTGTVLQSYLYRTPEDLERLVALKSRVRLVKGAYLEPPSVAFPEKKKVDEAYVTLAERMLDASPYPAIATHDEAIIAKIESYAADRGTERNQFEFQMLYGIRRDLQEKLIRDGYNVRVYVPFGNAWYPYFTRRLAERPANTGFILKSLFKG
jgi:proline dehydrogenase